MIAYGMVVNEYVHLGANIALEFMNMFLCCDYGLLLIYACEEPTKHDL
jgi:hypothetical protein